MFTPVGSQQWVGVPSPWNSKTRARPVASRVNSGRRMHSSVCLHGRLHTTQMICLHGRLHTTQMIMSSLQATVMTSFDDPSDNSGRCDVEFRSDFSRLPIFIFSIRVNFISFREQFCTIEMTTSSAQKNVLHWFRNGLRLSDNLPLLHAAEKVVGSNAQLYPIFIFDPEFVNQPSSSPHGFQFLIDSLQDLDVQLRSKFQSQLLILHGPPPLLFDTLLSQWNIGHVYFEQASEPYARTRDRNVRELCSRHDVSVHVAPGHTLFDLETYDASTSCSSFSAFSKGFYKRKVPPPIPLSDLSLPPLVELPPSFAIDSKSSSNHWGYSPSQGLPALDHVCSGEASSFSECVFAFPGGETEGLRRMANILARETYVQHFEKPKTSPTSLEASTTVLSPYLRFGCVSARVFWMGIQRVLDGAHARVSRPPVSLHGQLMFREMFHLAASRNPNFHHIEDNPEVRNIPNTCGRGNSARPDIRSSMRL